MSKVIQHVRAKAVKHVWHRLYCPDCDRNWTLKEGAENNIKEFPENKKRMEQPCPICNYKLQLIQDEWEEWTPGYVLVQCNCGKLIECRGFTTTCVCGCDYNGYGQQLAPRSQWGWETGEHWTDCY